MLDLCYRDPAHPITAGEDLDVLDRDLSDLSDLFDLSDVCSLSRKRRVQQLFRFSSCGRVFVTCSLL